jgi:hypothetical protein
MVCMKFGLAALLLTVLLPYSLEAGQDSPAPCKKSRLFSVHRVVAWSTSSDVPAFFYKSGMAIDADGAFHAYHPHGQLGLDSLAHAGHRGKWWALVTNNGKLNGRPVVQGKSDPAPGFYVSMTALYDPDNPNRRDPRRYVDAANIPYVVLHPRALRHARLGDFATVVNLENGKISGALVADESAPNLPFGEGSMALAGALGINSSPRHGGKSGGIAYVIYPGSGNGKPRSLEEINAMSEQLFEGWGGSDKLNACVANK